jgi:hypothetical protein
MVTTRVKPRGPFYACKHARTHARVYVDISAGIPAEDGGCYLALDSVTYQASCQASPRLDRFEGLDWFPVPYINI